MGSGPPSARSLSTETSRSDQALEEPKATFSASAFLLPCPPSLSCIVVSLRQDGSKQLKHPGLGLVRGWLKRSPTYSPPPPPKQSQFLEKHKFCLVAPRFPSRTVLALTFT